MPDNYHEHLHRYDDREVLRRLDRLERRVTIQLGRQDYLLELIIEKMGAPADAAKLAALTAELASMEKEMAATVAAYPLPTPEPVPASPK